MSRLFLVMGLLIILTVPQAWAAASPYPDPYRQTMWNNVTDSMHTLGQSPRQAALTKARLHNARAQARIHSINQAKRQAWLNSH